MKSSFFKKIICCLLICLMIQPTFGQEASIMLYYKPGINNVSFKYSGTHDSLNPINVNTEEYTDSTIVKITENNMGAGKKSDLSSYATDYVNNLQLFNHMVGLDTNAITPGQLNFWVNGNLSINGKEVSPFSLGMLSGYWWYGSHNGNRYVGNNDITDKGLDITDVSGTKYCLKEPSSNSDELFVYSGNCSEAGSDYAADVGKDKQQSFSFVYGPDIKSISFDVTNNQSEDGSGHKLSNNAIQTDNQGSLTKVTVTAGEIGSLGTANTFDHILGYMAPSMDMSHILQLMPANDPEAHKPAAAVKQNLWLTGKLKIDGQPVKGIIVLGHNTETNSNWWIGSTNGTRYDSPSNSGLNVVGANDNQAYCINGSQTNYQAVVTKSVCSDYSPTSGKIASPLLTLGYAQGINSVTFTPTESSGKNTYISEDGTGNPLLWGSVSTINSKKKYNTRVAVSAGVNGSYGTAHDFSKLLGIESSTQVIHSLELMDRRKKSAHEARLAQNMNFWVKGKLKIESYTVSENFIIGHSGGSDKNWWIGSPDGMRFDSSTNSGLNMQYYDSKEGVTHRYCLNLSKNNYSLVVSDGVCTAITHDERVNKDRIANIVIFSIMASAIVIWTSLYVYEGYREEEKLATRVVETTVGSGGEGALEEGSEGKSIKENSTEEVELANMADEQNTLTEGGQSSQIFGEIEDSEARSLHQYKGHLTMPPDGLIHRVTFEDGVELDIKFDERGNPDVIEYYPSGYSSSDLTPPSRRVTGYRYDSENNKLLLRIGKGDTYMSFTYTENSSEVFIEALEPRGQSRVGNVVDVFNEGGEHIDDMILTFQDDSHMMISVDYDEGKTYLEQYDAKTGKYRSSRIVKNERFPENGVHQGKYFAQDITLEDGYTFCCDLHYCGAYPCNGYKMPMWEGKIKLIKPANTEPIPNIYLNLFNK